MNTSLLLAVLSGKAWDCPHGGLWRPGTSPWRPVEACDCSMEACEGFPSLCVCFSFITWLHAGSLCSPLLSLSLFPLSVSCLYVLLSLCVCVSAALFLYLTLFLLPDNQCTVTGWPQLRPPDLPSMETVPFWTCTRNKSFLSLAAFQGFSSQRR